MEQINCENCGASDFFFTYKYQECKYCRTKYPIKQEVPEIRIHGTGSSGVFTAVSCYYPQISSCVAPGFLFQVKELE